MMKLRKRGFTLVEMLVVIVIIGALLAIAIPRLSQATHEARIRECAGNIKAMNSALELYNAKEGAYPDSLDTVTDDTEYFPDGTPDCPFDTGYEADDDVARVAQHDHSA